MYTVFWLEDLKGSDSFEDLHLDWKIMFESLLGKKDGKLWIGFVWLRIGISGRML
jgi:hypothetical protein